MRIKRTKRQIQLSLDLRFHHAFCLLQSAVGVAGLDEVAEERMRLEWFALELRMKLAAEEEWVLRNLDDLYVGCIGRRSGEPQTAAGQYGFILAVELVTMTMALGDLCCPVSFCGERAGFEYAIPRAQAHGAAHLFHANQLAQFIDDAVRRCRIELAGVGLRKPTDIARV